MLAKRKKKKLIILNFSWMTNPELQLDDKPELRIPCEMPLTFIVQILCLT
jgi:hypothetical protein